MKHIDYDSSNSMEDAVKAGAFTENAITEKEAKEAATKDE